MEEEVQNTANVSEETKVNTIPQEEETNITDQETVPVKDSKEEDTTEPVEEKKRFDLNNSNLRDLQIGDGNEINHYHNTISSDRHGLPVKLNSVDKDKIRFDVGDLATFYIQKLKAERFIILNCAHEGVGNSLKQNIIQQKDYDQHLKYEVYFDDYDGPSLQSLIEDCFSKILTDEYEKLVLFIHDSRNSPNPKLLKLLRNANDPWRKNILERIEKSIDIVYITYHENQKYLHGSSFSMYDIDAYRVYLKTYKIDKNLAHNIDRLKIRYGDVRSLLKDLDKYIKEDNFDEIIREKEKNEKEIDFLSVLRDKQQPVNKYVLFVAVLFPELAPDIFREYVAILLLNKKVLIDEKKTSLSKLWEDDTDQILNDCGLETYYVDNQYFVDFKTSIERTRCERFLFKKLTLFAVHQAKVLIDKQQLFTVQTPPKLHYRIHPVIAKLTGYFKDYYGDELLKQWLEKLENQRKEALVLQEKFKKVRADRNLVIKKIREFEVLKNIKSEQDSLKRLKKISPVRFRNRHDELIEELEYIKFLFYKEENIPDHFSITDILDELVELQELLREQLHEINNEYNKINSITYSRVYLFVNLLSAIYGEEGSKDLIGKFFTEGLQIIYKHHILLDVIGGFQIKNTSFNSTEYFKKSLEHPDNDITSRASNIFNELIQHQPSDFYHYHQLVASWFPSREKLKREYTKIEKQVQVFYFDVFMSFKKSDGQALKKNKFLDTETYKAIFEDESTYNTTIAFIIYHLFDMRHIHGEGRDSKQKQKQLTDLLAHWYYLLKKIVASEIQKESKAKLELLISTIRKELTKKQKTQLLFYLREKRHSYNERLSGLNHLNEKSITKNKRDALIEFTNLIKA